MKKLKLVLMTTCAVAMNLAAAQRLPAEEDDRSTPLMMPVFLPVDNTVEEMPDFQLPPSLVATPITPITAAAPNIELPERILNRREAYVMALRGFVSRADNDFIVDYKKMIVSEVFKCIKRRNMTDANIITLRHLVDEFVAQLLLEASSGQSPSPVRMPAMTTPIKPKE